jgi:hypothetical protein
MVVSVNRSFAICRRSDEAVVRQRVVQRAPSTIKITWTEIIDVELLLTLAIALVAVWLAVQVIRGRV